MGKTLIRHYHWGMILFLLGGFSSFLSAQENELIDSLVFSPTQFYVGDEVELYIYLKPQYISNESWDFSQVLPQSDFLQIKSLHFDARRALLQIIFISYRSGTQFLPSLVFGDQKLEGIPIQTLSLLENHGSQFLRSFHAPLSLPGTEPLIFFLLFLLMIIPFTFWRLSLLLSSLGKRLLRWYIYRRPYKVFLHEMNDLWRLLQKGDGSSGEFFSRLDKTLRRYLSARFQRDLFAMTTTELRQYLQAQHLLNEDHIRSFIDVFYSANMVKYADWNLSIDIFQETWQQVRTLCQGLEKEKGFYVDL